MKIAHTITLSVFAKDEENPETLKQKLIELVPFSLVEEKVNVQEQTVMGFNERKIKIYTITLEKQRYTTLFLDNLKEKLSSEQKEMLVRQRESRIDDHLCFFMRFEKKPWIEEQKLWITDGGECFHVKIHLAVFPKNKQIAIKMVEDFLGPIARPYDL